ncbi:MFS transporter [Candidatus Viridilinea mediisalina]|uniref:MFS transporter n=1 Tax=Candidatus Viridilinea mediisalina TaxID=2024553 RepID=A0A2A6RP88_9CHLR|nr:MFS transporter [Candidatus Viridilinea mediisalina]
MQRWQTTLWIMFTAQLISAVGFAVFFPFLPLYVADLGTQTGLSIEFWAGMAFSSQAITMALASPIWGSLADRVGYKLMVERAMYGGALILLLMAFVRSAEELVLLRAIQGMITGTISAANALVAAEVPRERLGYAMGTLQMGLWGGIALGPLIGGLLADAFGYRMPFVLTAGLLLLAGLLVSLGVRRGARPSPKADQPHQGLLASWRAILATSGMPLAYSLRFLASLAHTIFIPFAPLFILTLMATDERIGTVTGVMVGTASAASVATSIYLGRLGDQHGHRWVLIGCASLSVLLYLLHIFVTNPWQLLALQLSAGAVWGGVSPAISALLGRYTGTGSEGAVYGIDNAIVSIARAVAPILGALVVLLIGLRGIFIITALIYALVGGLALLRLPDPPEGRKEESGA